MKVLSLFSGIGAFEKALSNLGVEHEIVGFSELNDGYGKELQRVYKKIHGEGVPYLGEIQTVEYKNEVDIITHGSPCQDFSVAGDRKGGDKGSGTKSSLMWETVRVVEDTNPKVVIWENVKGVLYKNNIQNFNKYLKKMEDLGYKNYHKVLVGTDFGIPQKRERMFCVSIKKELSNDFHFPSPRKGEQTLRDVLETNVNDKYIVPRDMIVNWYNKKPPFGDRFSLLRYDDVGYTLVAKGGRAVITNNYILLKESDYCKIHSFKGKDALKNILDKELQLRALTPREYWRLQGWSDVDIDKVFNLEISDARLYKMAGNSIIIPILEDIFSEIIKNEVVK